MTDVTGSDSVVLNDGSSADVSGLTDVEPVAVTDVNGPDAEAASDVTVSDVDATIEVDG